MGKAGRWEKRMRRRAKSKSKRYIRDIMNTETYISFHEAAQELRKAKENAPKEREEAQIVLKGIMHGNIDKKLLFKALGHDLRIEMKLSEAFLKKLEAEKKLIKLLLKHAEGNTATTDARLEDLSIVLNKIEGVSSQLSNQKKTADSLNKQQERLRA